MVEFKLIEVVLGSSAWKMVLSKLLRVRAWAKGLIPITTREAEKRTADLLEQIRDNEAKRLAEEFVVDCGIYFDRDHQRVMRLYTYKVKDEKRFHRFLDLCRSQMTECARQQSAHFGDGNQYVEEMSALMKEQCHNAFVKVYGT